MSSIDAVSPTSGIDIVSSASSIDATIKACKEERRGLIPGLAQHQRVKRDIYDDYCDISGNVGDLMRLREFDVLYQSLGLQLITSKARWRTSDCISPRVQPLEHVGVSRLTNLNVDILDPTKLSEAKKDAIARFIGVLMPILGLYGLPLTTIHIFYDLGGSAVTFNRNGSIFVNLRHYEMLRMYRLLRLRHLHSPRPK